MHEKMMIGRIYSHPIPPGANSVRPNVTQNGGMKFQQLLDKELLSFSQHAKARLNDRGIHLSREDVAKIELAVDKAASKGAKDSLIMMQNVALIVNVPNKTVVTAMDKAGMQDHIFTNIDSAIIV